MAIEIINNNLNESLTHLKEVNFERQAPVSCDIL